MFRQDSIFVLFPSELVQLRNFSCQLSSRVGFGWNQFSPVWDDFKIQIFKKINKTLFYYFLLKRIGRLLIKLTIHIKEKSSKLVFIFIENGI